MLRTLGGANSTTRPGEGIVGVGSDSRAGHDGNMLDGSKLDRSEVDGGKVNNKIRKKFKKRLNPKICLYLKRY